MQYQKGQILKINEVGDYGEMWLEITDIGEIIVGVCRNKDWEVVHRFCLREKYLESYATPAPDEIKVGDVLEGEKDTYHREVLARIGDAYYLKTGDGRDSYCGWFLKSDFEYHNIKKPSTTPRTLTQEEARKILEEKLGEKIIIKE